jgi:hypothetical protein
LPGIDQHLLADFGGAGKGDLGHVHVQRQRGARGFAHAVHHIEHARRAAGLNE